MHNVKKTILSLCCMMAMSAWAAEYEVSSPNGKVKVTVTAEETVRWSVTYDGKTVLMPSDIGIQLQQGKNTLSLGKIGKVAKKQIRGSFENAFYRKQTVRDNYGQLLMHTNQKMSIEVRAYDDGAAYRLISKHTKPTLVKNETVEYCFEDDYQAFIPYVNDNRGGERYCYSFESYYDEQPLSKMFSDSLAITPLAVCLPGGMKAIVMDAGVENYPGMFLRSEKGKVKSEKLKAEFAPYPLEQEIGGFDRLNLVPTKRADYIAKLNANQSLPWRVVVITERDADILNCDIAQRLAPACRISDTSWIQPGKVAWDWWNNLNITGVDFKSGMNTNTYLYYIDFAAKNHLEYIIIDEGWSGKESLMSELNPEIDLQRLIAYGQEKGVGIILWSSWRNLIGSNPQGGMAVTDAVMKHYADMGIKGFKVDFFDRDDQQVMASAYQLAECAARHHLVLDYHGLKPFGIQRAYPNIFNFEGVKGLENSKWEPRVGEGPLHNQPRYDVTAPYLRMLAGPMDYTPGAMTNAMKDNFFGNNDHPMSQGTRVHQMAMYTTFEAPLQMLADSPTKYMQNQECTDFIAQIPTTFDETIALDGQLGEYTLIARRKGNTWYLAAMTDWTPRDLTVDLSFLSAGQHEADIFADGINATKEATDYQHRRQKVTPSDRLNIHLSSGGGWTAIIRLLSASQKSLSQHLLVPAWSLGHIIWEDSINTEQGAQRLYAEYAAHQIPVDGIIIDSPWSESYNDFNWDRQRYPHAEQMIRTFNNNGVKVILWLTGCVNTACKDTPKQKAANYDEAYRLRYGINDNTPSKWWKGEGLMTDFTNPKARDWWYTQLDKVFTDGVYGFKVDQGEIYFGDTVKTSVGSMTNRQFRKYYYDAISDYVRMRKPEGITIGRPYSHQGGFHSTPEKLIIGWCGDFGGDWEGLKLQIDNVYRSAQAGYGAVGCEVAGFMGAKATRLDFIRYAQFGAMTACMINGGENGAFSSHLPWYHGDDVSEIYRQCVVLHNQLRPYLFSVLVDAHLHGGGLLRRTSFEQESHLLGNDIFTKAITNSEGQATFTLPEDGEWVDYFSCQSFPGGTQLAMTYPIDRFPLFVRKGAIIPMAIDGSITYLVCPKGTTTRKLYLPTGDGTDYEECHVTYSEVDGQLTVNGKKYDQYKMMLTD